MQRALTLSASSRKKRHLAASVVILWPGDLVHGLVDAGAQRSQEPAA